MESSTTMAANATNAQDTTMADWPGQSYSLSCDKFGDMSWMPLDNVAPNQLAGPAQPFSMELCSQQYGMPLQSFDTMQFDTLVPAELNTAMVDDAVSSIQSWPNSPSSLPGAFSDAVTNSTHTSPDDVGTEPSSSRRHSYHHLQQHKTKSESSRSKRRASSSVSKPEAATTTPSVEGGSPSTSTAPSSTRTKKKTIREKNRTAATKYRNKTKKGIEELQEMESQLSEKNRILSGHVECLRNEILSLKTEILRHGTCESPLIQEYIMKTAKRL
ncbi:hypothetical protein Micbo1qcDRAFT_169004 [Microdochium bolleyi]|uniref:BZIP domain-containing protein n=1 Tax=Microdochium bolleyi TaxID=196109 RepID=A0A136IM01_9PEZI|nr:hypothetical protein Micbo1qcDRAFT_169004 [Microdochium bolleyi]